MNTDKLVSTLRARLSNLLAIYMFGSQASGDAGPDSDLDLAVLVTGKLDPLHTWELAGELADIAGCPVDLVDLRAASTVMQYQVISKGICLWSLDVQAGLYECFIVSEKLALDEARAGLIADIRNEGRIHAR